MISQLLTPLQYLRIRHPTRLPQLVNWVIPVGASTVVCLAVFGSGLTVDVFGDNGAIARCLGFLQSLPGFYIAALAAIVAFAGSSMDQPMRGDPPTMTIQTNGGPQRIELTRRRFLSAMFSYLTALSFVMTLGSIALLAIAKPMAALAATAWVPSMKFVVSFAYLAAVLHLFSITLWGLYYLGERIHRP